MRRGPSAESAPSACIEQPRGGKPQTLAPIEKLRFINEEIKVGRNAPLTIDDEINILQNVERQNYLKSAVPNHASALRFRNGLKSCSSGKFTAPALFGNVLADAKMSWQRATRFSAERDDKVAGEEKSMVLQTHGGRGLTLRSRRGSTAIRQAREAAVAIIPPRGPGVSPLPRLTSNVRPRKDPMHPSPRYSKPEIERRWLDPAASLILDKALIRVRGIEDRYIIGTRLRLRQVTESNHQPIYKLGKKYESKVDGAHQVVTTYLSEDEYRILARLPARLAKKQRFSVYDGSIDVYQHPEYEFRVFEIEFTNAKEAAAYIPPEPCGEEITNESKYSGFALAGSEA